MTIEMERREGGVGTKQIGGRLLTDVEIDYRLGITSRLIYPYTRSRFGAAERPRSRTTRRQEHIIPRFSDNFMAA